jgi:hypothetical protein
MSFIFVSFVYETAMVVAVAEVMVVVMVAVVKKVKLSRRRP